MKDVVFSGVPVRLYDLDTQVKSSGGIVFYHGSGFNVLSVGEKIR